MSKDRDMFQSGNTNDFNKNQYAVSAEQKNIDDDINELRRKYKDMMHKDKPSVKVQKEKMAIETFDVVFWIILIFITAGLGLLLMPLYIWAKRYRMEHPYRQTDELDYGGVLGEGEPIGYDSTNISDPSYGRENLSSISD